MLDKLVFNNTFQRTTKKKCFDCYKIWKFIIWTSKGLSIFMQISLWLFIKGKYLMKWYSNFFYKYLYIYIFNTTCYQRKTIANGLKYHSFFLFKISTSNVMRKYVVTWVFFYVITIIMHYFMLFYHNLMLCKINVKSHVK